MTYASPPDWCKDPDALSDLELKLLVEAAVSVLSEQGEERAEVEDVTDMPRGVLTAQVHDELTRLGLSTREADVSGLVDDVDASRRLGVALVGQICLVPALREEVDEAYRARQGMMVAEPVSLLAVALLLLVVKLRRVKVGKQGVEVELDPVKPGIVAAVGKVLGV